MQRQSRNQSSNSGHRPADDYLAEIRKRHGDRDDFWEIAAYVVAYLVGIGLVFLIFDLRGVGAALIITAIVAVLMFARSALVSILAVIIGVVGLGVYLHVVYQFFGA